MNRLLKISTPLLGLTFIALLFLSVRMMLSSRSMQPNADSLSDKKGYQYAFFLPASDDSIFNSLKSGALEAAKEADCAVIFHALDQDSLAFEMASYAGANGIAVFSYQKDEKTALNLEKILKKGVPIVQIENEVIRSPNTVLIGTNRYDLGKSIGKIALTSGVPRQNIGLIFSDKNPALREDANLVEMGIKSIMGNRLSRLYTGKTTSNPIDAEGVIHELLRLVPAVDIIALTDSSDTLVAIQAIVDLNLVGQVRIIGFGEDETIKDYVKKGIVLGSIVRNPYRIGFNAVTALYEINRNGNTSAYVDTGINIITNGDGGSQ